MVYEGDLKCANAFHEFRVTPDSHRTFVLTLEDVSRTVPSQLRCDLSFLYYIYMYESLIAALKPVGTGPSSASYYGSDSDAQSTDESSPSFASTPAVCDRSQSLLGELVLSDSHAEEVVSETSPEEQWADQRREGRGDRGGDGSEHVGGHTGVVGRSRVVKEVENATGGQPWTIERSRGEVWTQNLKWRGERLTLRQR